MDKYSELINTKKKFEKYEIHLKGNREYLYSGWEINQISTALNNSYYKNELLNTLTSLVNQGTNPENIYILNASVKVGQQYDNIKNGLLDLKTPSGLINLYYLGSPIPLFPNKKITKIYCLFEMFRLIFKACKKGKITPPNRKDTLFKIVTSLTSSTSSSNIKDILEKEITEVNSDLKTNSKFNLSEIVKSVIRSPDKLYLEWDNLDSIFDEIKTNINTTDLKLKEAIHSKEFMTSKRYFTTFTDTFNKLDRPIICIHTPENNNIHILCTDMIALKNFTPDNYRFFETNNISQNSPLIMCISLGIGFLPSIFKLGDSVRLAWRTKRDAISENQQRLDEIAELDRQIAELENDLTANQPIVNEVNTVLINQSNSSKENELAHDTINSLTTKNFENVSKTLHEKDINISSINTKQEDIQEIEQVIPMV